MVLSPLLQCLRCSRERSFTSAGCASTSRSGQASMPASLPPFLPSSREARASRSHAVHRAYRPGRRSVVDDRQRGNALGQRLVTNLRDPVNLLRPFRPCAQPPQMCGPSIDVRHVRRSHRPRSGHDSCPATFLIAPKLLLRLSEFVSGGIRIVEHIVQFREHVTSVARIEVTVDTTTPIVISSVCSISSRIMKRARTCPLGLTPRRSPDRGRL